MKKRITERRKRRGRNEGAVFYLKKKKLWAACQSLGLDASGKRRRKIVYSTSKTAVLEKLKKLSLNEGRPIAELSAMTTAAWLDEWLGIVQSKRAPNTHLRYSLLVAKAKDQLGHIPLQKLQPAQIETAVANLDLSASERSKLVKMLTTCFRVAVKRRLLTYDPAASVERPEQAELNRKEGMALSPEQAMTLIKEAAKDRLGAIVAVALDSGCRQGELMALGWDCVDFARGTIRVRHSLEELQGTHRLKVPKTPKSRRMVELSAIGIDALRQHRERMLKEGHIASPVFCDADGGFLRKSNFYRRVFKPIVKRAGLSSVLTFHDLRHTHATLLLQSGVNVSVVSERLGHANAIVTLTIYSHVLVDGKRTAATAIGKMLSLEGGQSTADVQPVAANMA